MGSEDNGRGASHLFARQPRTVEGAAAVEGLQALSDSVHDADEQALRALAMLPVDALALRHLVRADQDGQGVSPTQLAQTLRLSTAGVTKLIDRLVRAGQAEREPNPTDRRGIIVRPSGTAERDLALAYGHIHAPLISVIDGLSADEASAVQRFAVRLAEALRRELAIEGSTPLH